MPAERDAPGSANSDRRRGNRRAGAGACASAAGALRRDRGARWPRGASRHRRLSSGQWRPSAPEAGARGGRPPPRVRDPAAARPGPPGPALVDVGLDEIWGAVGPCVAVHRRDLHELLREAAGVPIRWGTTLESADVGATNARVRFDDGSDGDYDLLVGADGVHFIRAPADLRRSRATSLGAGELAHGSCGSSGDHRLDRDAGPGSRLSRRSHRRRPPVLLRGRQLAGRTRAAGRRPSGPGWAGAVLFPPLMTFSLRAAVPAAGYG